MIENYICSLIKEEQIKNWIDDGLEIRFTLGKGIYYLVTNDKGRGLFATKDFKKGDLLLVEKALAGPMDEPRLQATLWEYAKEKRVEALRLNYLYDGRETKDLKIPPMELFLRDEFK